MNGDNRDQYGDWTPEAQAARKQAYPKTFVAGRWVHGGGHRRRKDEGDRYYNCPSVSAPRGDLRREIAASLTERGLRLSGRQKVRARKAMRRDE